MLDDASAAEAVFVDLMARLTAEHRRERLRTLSARDFAELDEAEKEELRALLTARAGGD
jgi:hypothetical protein